jgi:hypothetical protein
MFGLRSSGLWHCIVLWVVTSVSEKSISSIFRVGWRVPLKYWWPSVRAWQRCEAVASKEFSVVTFYRLTIASLAWTTLLGCLIYLATLVRVRLCTTWPDRNRPRSTRIQSTHPTLPTLLHSVVLIGFHPSFTIKGICYSKNDNGIVSVTSITKGSLTEGRMSFLTPCTVTTATRASSQRPGTCAHRDRLQQTALPIVDRVLSVTISQWNNGTVLRNSKLAL